MDQPPNFDKAIRVHTAIKYSTLNEFKQPSTAATLLGISEKVFARVTGAVLVSGDNDTDWIRKINIGLQLKVRGVVSKNSLVNFICIDLISPLIAFVMLFIFSVVPIERSSFT